MLSVLLSTLCPPAPLKSLTFWRCTYQIIITIIIRTYRHESQCLYDLEKFKISSLNSEMKASSELALKVSFLEWCSWCFTATRFVSGQRLLLAGMYVAPGISLHDSLGM